MREKCTARKAGIIEFRNYGTRKTSHKNSRIIRAAPPPAGEGPGVGLHVDSYYPNGCGKSAPVRACRLTTSSL